MIETGGHFNKNSNQKKKLKQNYTERGGCFAASHT